MHLATVRQHYQQGLRSVARLIESFEMEIERLTLAQNSSFHLICLERTVESQKSELQRLSQTLENKSAQLLSAQRTNLRAQKEFQTQFAAAQELNHHLQTRIRELEKCLESDSAPRAKLDSHNSSLPPSLDPPWSKPTRTRSLRTRSGLKVGGQPGHTGSTLLQIADPDSVIVHRVDVCGHCQNSLIPVESQRFQKRQIFEIDDGRLAVIEHRVEIKHCGVCRKITKGQFPPQLKAPVQYGTSVFARIVYLNHYQLLPVARTRETMEDLFNCPVSPATIQRATKVCGDKLMRSEFRLKAAVRSSEVIGVDETGIRIAGRIAWVHLARTDLLTHLAAHPKRGRQAFEEIGIINRFAGVLVRDGFSSYQRYEQCRHSLCNVHLLRNLTFVAENEPAQKVWTVPLTQLLLRIKEAVHQAKLKSQPALTAHQRGYFFGSYYKILTEAEQIIRGSPKLKGVHLSAHNLFRRFLLNLSLELKSVCWKPPGVAQLVI